jgi:hypothetical protein
MKTGTLSYKHILPFLHVLPVALSGLFLIESANAEILTKCGKYASVNVGKDRDSYTVHNNIWNDHPNSHCIEVDRGNGAFRVTSSRHNKSTLGAPAGYSFINKGCHWGVCAHARGDMPKQVSTILEARSSWSTTQAPEGIYNVAYDIWFHPDPGASGQPDGTELMIWLAYKGDIQPVGSLTGMGVPIGDAKWDIWTGWNGANGVITYVRANSVESVSDLSIKTFIVDAVARGYVQNDWYLISLGAGFEIWKGGEGLASNAFSFQLE